MDVQMKPTLTLLIAGAAALLSAGAAAAQSATPALQSHMADVRPARAFSPIPRPTGVAAPATPTSPIRWTRRWRGPSSTQTLDSEVFATTAVDHKFGKRDDLTGSLGLLCGRQPEHTESGGAAAYGSDPHGRFVSQAQRRSRTRRQAESSLFQSRCRGRRCGPACCARSR